MQAPSFDMLHFLQTAASDGKFWIGLGTVIIGGYKAFEWIKQIRTKDLKEIHSGIKELSTQIDNQTNSVVGELKEMRADFRTFYISPAPQMLPARARPVKKPAAKRTPAKRSPRVSKKALDKAADLC